MSLAIIAPCRSVHMGATQVPKRGEGEEPRFFLTDTSPPQRAYALQAKRGTELRLLCTRI